MRSCYRRPHWDEYLAVGHAAEVGMERTCFVIEIDPAAADEYERRHREIWPEMVEAIRDSGIRNFTGFLRGHEVIYYAECDPDVATSFAKLATYAVNDRWTASFAGIVTKRDDESGSLPFLREVAHLD
jgi:L-rhamnose mutarotase